MLGYFIEEKNGLDLKTQQERNKYNSIRIAKVQDVFCLEKPSILPFKGKFPLVSPVALDVVKERMFKTRLFEEVPRHLQEVVYRAEQIVYYSNKFDEYLHEIYMNPKYFENLDSNEKLNVLYDFLDKIQAGMSILEIKGEL